MLKIMEIIVRCMIEIQWLISMPMVKFEVLFLLNCILHTWFVFDEVPALLEQLRGSEYIIIVSAYIVYFGGF